MSDTAVTFVRNPDSESVMIKFRTLILAVFAVLAVAAAAFTSTAAASGPTGFAASKNCSPPKYPGNGYFTSLKVTGTGCTTGKRVALSHYQCRTRNGKKGRCGSRVRGFRCSESRNTIPTEINSRVTCKDGSKRVVFTYQQNI